MRIGHLEDGEDIRRVDTRIAPHSAHAFLHQRLHPVLPSSTMMLHWPHTRHEFLMMKGYPLISLPSCNEGKSRFLSRQKWEWKLFIFVIL